MTCIHKCTRRPGVKRSIVNYARLDRFVIFTLLYSVHYEGQMSEGRNASVTTTVSLTLAGTCRLQKPLGKGFSLMF